VGKRGYKVLVNLRIYLELGYFISGIIVSLAAVAGLRQLRLFKKDIRLRNERAAKEKAIEYALRYLTSYVDAQKVFLHQTREKKLPPYKGSIGDFSADSLPKELLDSSSRRYTLVAWLPAMNELLAIASAFTSGVADEATGFNIIGRTYCATVQDHYDILSMSRRKGVHDYFQSIVDLYQLWAPRLSKAELEEQRRMISERLETHKDAGLPFIGSD
jgi:hypothetical protein